MSKKRAKSQIKANPLADQAKHKKDYMSRVKMVCDKLVGPGWFEIIPKAEIDNLYGKRYPPLTIKLGPGVIMPPGRFTNYRTSLSELLNVPAFDIHEFSIPLKTMLSEGLTLIHFISSISANRFDRSEELRTAFNPFLITSNSYYGYLIDQLASILFVADLRNGNYNDGFLHADRTQTNLRKLAATPNAIFVHFFRPIVDKVIIEGYKREIIAVNRFVPKGISLQVKFRPSALGIHSVTDEPLPLYIQRHALQRLDERLGLKAENVHAHLFFSLYEQPVNYVKVDGRILIEYNMYEYKVGYLVTTMHDDKLVILTFLFLTNDGTPEGRRLRSLTGLAKRDKKYLEIDKLSTFTAYRIHEDHDLSELFRQAGCGSLLEAEALQSIAAEYMPERSKAILRKFLAKEALD
ncbi:hypothetical protein [Mucilaginibacter sp. NFR10]|uniref:hypothetical protein n=1 Tax=Mucilaginibacter sp. NFR10 TaxID=1566292 RepID=UPI0008718F81|nr:hypothetical protein [Mucilaginibacter sp. NFR10]SCW38347.1 hypothetical protein SAMN03159284_00133 [Mucilaginibacter sp. NFR10]